MNEPAVEEDDLVYVELDATFAEASDLLACRIPAVLEAHGFDRAFWAVGDEGPVEMSIVLIGHKAGKKPHKGWKVKRLKAKLGKACKGIETEDCEALARRGDELWVLGSHFGGKDGPLDEERAFVALLSEAGLEGKVDATKQPLRVQVSPFRLHRAANDAFRKAGLELIPLGTEVRRRFIEDSLRAASDEGAPWAPDIRVEDWPINIEGAAFEDDGSLLLGLRFPVTAEGAPLILRLRRPESLLEPRPDPQPQHPDPVDEGPGLDLEVAAVLKDAGSRARASGIRGLRIVDGRLHVLTGPLDSEHKENAIAMEYPGSQLRPCEHWSLPLGADGQLGEQKLERVRTFDRLSVEGLANDDVGWLYVIDEEGGVVLGLRP